MHLVTHCAYFSFIKQASMLCKHFGSVGAAAAAASATASGMEKKRSVHHGRQTEKHESDFRHRENLRFRAPYLFCTLQITQLSSRLEEFASGNVNVICVCVCFFCVCPQDWLC